MRGCVGNLIHTLRPQNMFFFLFMRGYVGDLLHMPRPQNLFGGLVEGLVWGLVQGREIGMGRVCGLIEGFRQKS